MFQLSDNGHILVPTTFPEHRSFSKQCCCLHICNDVGYCQGILRGKEIPEDCPNHKWSNLCRCLVHFLQVALPGIGTFVILPASLSCSSYPKLLQCLSGSIHGLLLCTTVRSGWLLSKHLSVKMVIFSMSFTCSFSVSDYYLFILECLLRLRTLHYSLI